MDQHENIDELIAKCLAEEASVLEKEIVNSWIAVSDANKKYYSDSKVIYKKAGKKTVEDEIAVSAAWKKFSEGLPVRKDKKPILKRIAVSFYSKAAIVIGMIGVGYFFYKNAGQEEKEIILSSVLSEVLNDTLPDGTFVSLAPKSTLTYSSSFNSGNRELKLSGEAYFRVQYNQDIPFIVKADNIFIEDVSTAFTVKSDPEDSVVTVFVEEGKVFFYSAHHPGISLVQNETGIYNKSSSTFRKKEDPLSDIQSVAVRTLTFESTTLRSVVDTLNKVYNAHLVLSCPKLASLKLTATFTEATVQPIIETISETLNLSATTTTGSILLDSETCKNE